MHEVKEVKCLKRYKIEIKFDDGIVKTVDLEDRISRLSQHNGSIFAQLLDLDFFGQVRVNSEIGTICWPNNADFCPDVLYDSAS